MSATVGAGAGDDEDEDRKALTRSRYLARTTDLTDREALALAYREMGYSASGVAGKIDSSAGTVRSYMRRTTAQYGWEATFTKLEEERGDLEEVTPERLDELSPQVRAAWREQASHSPEHVPEAVRGEVIGE